MRLFIHRGVAATDMAQASEPENADAALPWFYSRKPARVIPMPITTSDRYDYALQFAYAPWGLGWLAPLLLFPRPWERNLLVWLYRHGFLAVPEGHYDLHWSQLRVPWVARRRLLDLHYDLVRAKMRADAIPGAVVALISAGSEVLDKAADVEFDGWSREHVALEAAYGQLITALEPFAVTRRRAKAQRRPA